MRVNSNSSKAVAALSSMWSELQGVKSALGNDISEREKFLTHIQKLDEALEARRIEENSISTHGSASGLYVITVPDSRVTIENSASLMTGTFELKPIIFEKILNTADHLPRTVKVYNQIGDIRFHPNQFHLQLDDGALQIEPGLIPL